MDLGRCSTSKISTASGDRGSCARAVSTGPLTQPPVLPKIRPPPGQCALEIARPGPGTVPKAPREEALNPLMLLLAALVLLAGVSHTPQPVSGPALMIEGQEPGPSQLRPVSCSSTLSPACPLRHFERTATEVAVPSRNLSSHRPYRSCSCAIPAPPRRSDRDGPGPVIIKPLSYRSPSGN